MNTHKTFTVSTPGGINTLYITYENNLLGPVTTLGFERLVLSADIQHKIITTRQRVFNIEEATLYQLLWLFWALHQNVSLFLRTEDPELAKSVRAIERLASHFAKMYHEAVYVFNYATEPNILELLSTKKQHNPECCNELGKTAEEAAVLQACDMCKMEETSFPSRLFKAILEKLNIETYKNILMCLIGTYRWTEQDVSKEQLVELFSRHNDVLLKLIIENQLLA